QGHGAFIDDVRIAVPNAGYANTSIELQDPTVELPDCDGSETLTLVIGDVPVGATLADGTYSFTATTGETSVDITAWADWTCLAITPPLDFYGTFTLTVTATSTEAVTEETASTTRTMIVTVLAPPIALDSNVTTAEDTPYVFEWSDFQISDADSESLFIDFECYPSHGWLQYFDGEEWDYAQNWTPIARADVEAGKLRFLPAEHESGYDGYETEGEGNLAQDYASFTYRAYDGLEWSDTATMTIDVTPVVDTPLLRLTGYGGSIPNEVVHTNFNAVPNPDNGATILAQSTFEGWTLVTGIPEANAGGVDVFEIWGGDDVLLNANGQPVSLGFGEGDSCLELNDAAGAAYQTFGLERTIETVEGRTYEVSLWYAAEAGFDDTYGEIGIYVDGEQIGTYTSTSTGEWLSWRFISFQFEGTGEAQTIRIVTEPSAVAPQGHGAFIDDVRIAVPNAGYANTSIELQDPTVELPDCDGSETLTLVIGD